MSKVIITYSFVLQRILCWLSFLVMSEMCMCFVVIGDVYVLLMYLVFC